uniref:Uncharacterized protein n=1 Tax=Candidatus Kentrum sp. DK TaxID=2126562 RepID=A0A450SP34_9GAMM|nr:MAG: hypothetical protein BECKDK2373B_GA0170837_105326 [Candidatus Kentron sp. DK]
MDFSCTTFHNLSQPFATSSNTVTDGMQQPSPWTLLKRQIYLGGEDFIKRTRRAPKDRDLSEIPKAQRQDGPKTLDEYSKTAETRNEAIVLANGSGSYTLEQGGRQTSAPTGHNLYSPGQRPGEIKTDIQRALKGRHNLYQPKSCLGLLYSALTGLNRRPIRSRGVAPGCMDLAPLGQKE